MTGLQIFPTDDAAPPPGPLRDAPRPVGTRIVRMAKYGFPATVIVRDWLAGDTRRCRLCPTCSANHARATCTIVAIGLDVRGHEAPLFVSSGLPVDQAGSL